MTTEIRFFTIELGYMPQEDVAYFKCRDALAKLDQHTRERVLIRLAHPQPEDENERNDP
jgi:hypothetical protein